MVHEQPPERARHAADATPDPDRLLDAVASFGAAPDRAALVQRVGAAVRDLLCCDVGALLEGAGGGEGVSGPLRAALLAHARASGGTTCVSARDLLHAVHDAAPAEVWAVAPLPAPGSARALVAGWRAAREPKQRELRALDVLARWAGASVDLRDRQAVVDASFAASEEFVSAAAHELRTPLTPLRLTIDRASRALAARDDPGRARDALARVDDHVRRMTHLVDSLLEASRVARGDLVLVRRDTDLGALVDDVVARYACAARQSRCELAVEVHERVVGRWDSGRLKEVLAQLVANAIKFGGGQPVRVRVSRSGGAAQVVVRDGGGGIVAEDHERIFARFERGVSVRNFGGLGVGLWLAREIARAHGGDVTVASAPGEGAEFTLTIPATGRASARAR